MKIFLLFWLCILAAFNVKAQDRIYLKSGYVIPCKVISSGIRVVKYQTDTSKKRLQTVLTRDVSKLELGPEKTVIEFGQDSLAYNFSKTRAVKFDLLTPAFNALSFSYEQSIGQRLSLEGTVGLIGIGADWEERRPIGGNTRFGLKMYKNYYKDGSLGRKQYNVLHGTYLMVGVYYGGYVHDQHFVSLVDDEPVPSQRREVHIMGIQAFFGRQSVIYETVTIDWLVGFGYNLIPAEDLGTQYYEPWYNANHYGYLNMENIMTGTLGVRIGYMMK